MPFESDPIDLPLITIDHVNNNRGTTLITKKIFTQPPSALLGGIIGLEAILSLLDLSVFPGVMPVTKVLGYIFPVINNFMLNTSVPTSVAPYIALTCVLLPVKVFVAYLFILKLSPEDKLSVVVFPMSNSTLSRKIFSTFLVLTLNVGLGLYVFSYGDISYFNADMTLNTAAAKYRFVSAGGMQMWLGWSVMHLIIMASLLGLLVSFVEEWFHFLFNSNPTSKE